MIDWQGNKVRNGDVVVFVSIVKLGNPIQIAYQDPVTGALIRSKVKAHDGFNFCWLEYYEAQVFEHEGVLFMDIPNDTRQGAVAFPVDIVQDMNNDPNNIFCVKRKTDSERLFYADYFKPHMN